MRFQRKSKFVATRIAGVREEEPNWKILSNRYVNCERDYNIDMPIDVLKILGNAT